MIGHKRMVTLTHALENALDGLRKQQFPVTSPFIDLCLEAVDALRLLRDEVITGNSSTVEVENLAARFSGLGLQSQNPVEVVAPVIAPVETKNNNVQMSKNKPVYVQVKISEHSVASAARAFQVVLVLQEAGNILALDRSNI